jgi:uncharacterized protein YprB with RNaseH-like and TPR domain
MLRHTFCHLPGIGPKVEQKLWQTGVHSWEALLAQCGQAHRSALRGRDWSCLIEESLQEYERGNPAFFGDRLPPNQVWRLFKDFQHCCAYLDIETTGLGSPGDYITTIAVYDGTYLRSYVEGVNLHEFPRDIVSYKLLVTYNGKTFDLPFLERQFDISLDQAHIDLRYVLHSLGLKGGLKHCEKGLGLERPGLEEVDGFAAVLLWEEYRRSGNPRALETLLAYNVQDTINLQILMREAYNRKLRDTPFAGLHELPEPPRAQNPFTPDPHLVDKVRRALSWRLPYVR